METARELTENLAALLRREHDALAEFLIALADFDRRRAWVEMGHSSLFYFLHRELRLSKSAAQYRKVAAELIQEIPGIVEPLRRGDLCLSSIIEAARVVTAENWQVVLPRFYGLSRREATEVVAALQPHPAPPVRTVVIPVRAEMVRSRSDVAGAPQAPGVLGRCEPRPQALGVLDRCEPRPLSPGSAGPEVGSLGVSSSEEPARALAAPSTSSVTSASPVEVTPLTADLSRLHVTVSKDLLRKLEAARDALSHARPGVNDAELLEAGLDLLLAQAAKRKGLVEKPQKTPRPSRRDHVPAHVRREVWKRDGGKCQWRLESGGICGATRHLELDHVHPKCLGGASTADNLRVTCRFHNGWAARLVLGDDLMDRYAADPRGPGAGARAPRARAARLRLRAGVSAPQSESPAPGTGAGPEYGRAR